MEKTHWKKLTNPNYLGDYSMPTDGSDLIVTIDYVRYEEVVGTNGRKENKVVAHFVEKNIKPMILNKTNMKTITKVYKTPYIEEWGGRKIQIYFDKTVKFARDTVGGLRIRNFVPAQNTVPTVCADCKAKIEPASGKDAEWVAKYTYQQYGKSLCAKCAQKIKDAQDAQKAPDAFQ